MQRSFKVLLKATLPSRVPLKYKKKTLDGSVVLIVLKSGDSSSNVESSSIRKLIFFALYLTQM